VTADDPTVEVHLSPEELRASMARDAVAGLAHPPRWIPATWFYDEVGSKLFDEITRLPEYYPTRTERAILTTAMPRIATMVAPSTLVEIGSGASDKTALVLDGLAATLRTFVAFDVSEPTLSHGLTKLQSSFPQLRLHGVVGDFRRHLPLLLDSAAAADSPRIVMFLGGTIGNLNRGERAEFLGVVASRLGPDDRLLLGTDLVKDPARLVAAYHDAAGVTAAFNRNVLEVLNHELDGDADPNDFEHVAVWNASASRIEMRLRAVRPTSFRLRAVELEVSFAEGEELLTEICCKFTPTGLAAELQAAGLVVAEEFRDPARDFQVTLARPA
jgi:L-histidine N-alpha-methyltransferase